MFSSRPDACRASHVCRSFRKVSQTADLSPADRQSSRAGYCEQAPTDWLVTWIALAQSCSRKSAAGSQNVRVCRRAVVPARPVLYDRGL